MVLKLLMLISSVLIVTAVLLGSFIINQQTRQLTHLYEEKAESYAHALDAGIILKDFEDLSGLQTKLLKFLWLNSDIHVITAYKLNEQNELLRHISTHSDKSETYAHSIAQDVFKADTTKIIPSMHDGVRSLTVFAPSHSNGKVIGVYELVISLALVDKTNKDLTIALSLATLVGIFLSLFTMYVITRVIFMKPIQYLVEGARRIGEGNLSYRIRVSSQDEAGQLALSFNTMAARLEEMHKNLESKVSHQTTELAEQVENTKKQNVSLENTKKAMMNLLEDARGLEGQIRNERDRAQGIITSMTEGLFVVDTNYRLQVINPMAAHMLSLDPKQVLGKDITEFVQLIKSSQSLARDERPLWKTITTGNPVKGEIEEGYSLKTAGKEVPVAFATAPLRTEGKIIGAIVTFHDITHELQEKQIIEDTVEARTRELREKNEALAHAQQEISHGWMQVQKEKARLTASINSLSLGFILTDQTEGVFMINAAAMNILGLKAHVYHISEMDTSMGGALTLHELLSKCAGTKEQVKKSDVFYKNKYITITVTPVLLDGKERDFLGTIISLDDITEAKVTQRSRDEFFSIASHELRTPLTAIRGNTAMINEFFADVLRDKKELKEMIDDIYASSIRLIRIVNDFLNVSRLEMGKIEFKKANVDIVDLIAKVNKELMSSAEEKHITVTFEAPSTDFPHIHADPDRTKEVLINLIGNAIKYTEKGGVIIRVTSDNSLVKVDVCDSGPGIPKENWDLLFRKFQQAGDSLLTRDTKRSTGLGLYISKLMVEGMGGTINLESSEVGKGSTFVFTLPVSS